MCTCWKAYGAYFHMVLIPCQNSYRGVRNLQNKPRTSFSPNLIAGLKSVLIQEVGLNCVTTPPKWTAYQNLSEDQDP